MEEQGKLYRLVIPQGLDYPNQYLFWEMPELLLGLSSFVIFMLLHELLLGLLLMLLNLYVLHKIKSHVRGSIQHFAWQASFPIRHKGLEFAPPAAVTRFDT